MWLRDRVRLRTRLRAGARACLAWIDRPRNLSGSTVGSVWCTLELPRPDEGLEDPEVLLVSGWVVFGAAPLSEAVVFLDDQLLGRARLGLYRPRAPGVPKLPWSSLGGFELLASLPSGVDGLSSRSDDCARLTVICRALNGESVLVSDRLVRRAGSDLRLSGAAPRHLPPSKPRGRRPSTGHGSLLVVTHDLGIGGAQLWLLDLLRACGAGRDFPCDVRVERDGSLSPVLQDLGIRVEVSGRTPLRSVADYDADASALARRIEREGVSVVLANTAGMFLGPDASERAGIPCLWAIHESWAPPAFLVAAFGPGGIHPELRARVMDTIRRCPALLFESEATKRLWEPWAMPGASLVVPYGIDTGAAEARVESLSQKAARAALGVETDARVALVMGTIEGRKGQTVLVEAFAEVADALPDWQLVLVGDQHTPYSQALRQFVRSVGLDGRVHILPVAADAGAWYLASDLLVIASDVESLPRSALDAMAHGLPVLATAVFGLTELLDDGVTGFLYESCSVEAAAEALRRVLKLAPGQLAAVGRSGQALVRRSYDVRAYGLRIRRVLEELTDGEFATARSET